MQSQSVQFVSYKSEKKSNCCKKKNCGLKPEISPSFALDIQYRYLLCQSRVKTAENVELWSWLSKFIISLRKILKKIHKVMKSYTFL